ncbi:MAG: metallophosphoesterase [Clostridia bacterium]|nr:metallophosphoesterase [Clostridia bacterium]
MKMKMTRLDEALESRFALTCREDGTFRVLCVSDFHAPREERWDARLKWALEALIRENDPDLVYIAGDLTDEADSMGSPERLREYLADIMAYCEENQIPWAHIPGNHDREVRLPPEIFAEFPHCVSKRGEASLPGYGTYLLPVYKKGEENKGPVFCIWGFDTHTGMGDYAKMLELAEPSDLYYLPTGFDRYAGPAFAQCRWYWEVSLAMEERFGRKTPGIMILHAPLPEHGLIPANPTQTGMKGTFGEFTGCASINTGLFAAACERGEIKEIVSGHDHYNNFSGNHMGITLSQDASLGHDGYGDDAIRGGRLLVFQHGTVSSRHVAVKDCCLVGQEEMI